MMKETDGPTHDELREQIFQLVQRIPRGKVINYGSIGAACQPPISGYICGRLMRNTPEGVPWWRVLAKDGSLPTSKRSPEVGSEQRNLLTAEGIEFEQNGKVQQKYFSML